MLSRNAGSSRIVPLILSVSFGAILSCSDKGTEPQNRPPQITSSATVEAVIDEPLSYTATAFDPDGDPVTVSYLNIPSWTDTSGNVLSGTPSAQTPDTSFTIIASDEFLSANRLVTVSIVAQPGLVSYANDVQPIFNSNCGGTSCHIGGRANGLSLASYSSLMQGGFSGPVVIPGDPDNSIIIRRLEGDIQPQMPFGGSPLPQSQIQLIRDWIAQGAHDN